MPVDNGLQIRGQGLVDFVEVDCSLEVILVSGLSMGEAAGILVLFAESDQVLTESGVGSGTVFGDELGLIPFKVLLPGACVCGFLRGEDDGREKKDSSE